MYRCCGEESERERTLRLSASLTLLTAAREKVPEGTGKSADRRLRTSVLSQSLFANGFRNVSRVRRSTENSRTMV